MKLGFADWSIMATSMLITVGIGVYGGRASGKSSEEYFLSGRSMPWWLLGISMVATTFSTDTPNLVTGLTRTHGVAGNWLWWAFLLTSMLTAFFFAPLWRRSQVTTDIEFYELRYSGAPAAFLRAFRGIYVGILVNVLIMGAVTLAAVKFGSVLFGFTPLQCVSVAGTATVIFAAAGGLRGVILSDCFLFILAMTGSIAVAYFSVHHPAVGGLAALFHHPNVRSAADFIPSASDPSAIVMLLVMPLLVQWWSVWYPGAEPGGGGFVAQRMFAAKDETNSIWAIVLFNVCHYALRPWPWILVALSSLVVFPDLESMRRAFPGVDPNVINQDFGYAAMLTFIPPGWLGLIAASLTAAYFSMIATSLNMGSAYIVNDIYKRFLRKNAGEREKVLMGRIATAALMVLAAVVALSLKSAMQAFDILLSIGAGTGLLFIVRWFWPRISAWSEISAMIIAFAVSMFLQLTPASMWPEWAKLLTAVGVTSGGWLIVTLLTPPTAPETLRSFYLRARPPGKAWRAVALEMGVQVDRFAESRRLTAAFVCMASGCGCVYCLLFSTGSVLRGDALLATGFGLGVVVFAWVCFRGWRRMRTADDAQVHAAVGLTTSRSTT